MKSILEIKEKIKPGDIETASKALGISPSNGSKAFSRVGSKYHNAIISMLNKVIEMREMLINANS